MKNWIKNLLAFSFSFLIVFGVIFFFFTEKEKEFKIYLDGTEVDIFSLNTGFEILVDVNETLFELCAYENVNISNVGWVDAMMFCMNGTGIQPIVNNVSKENLTMSWINANCDVGDDFQCGRFNIKLK